MLGEHPRNLRVKEQLEKHGIEAVYLLDKPIMRAAPPQERRSWFQDDVHLTTKGHAVWGELIREHLVAKLRTRTLMGGERSVVRSGRR